MKIQHLQRIKGVLAAVGTAALISISSAQARNRGFDPFNSTMEGQGSVRVNGSTYKIDQLQVSLQGNDRISIRADLQARNNRDLVMTGKLRDSDGRPGRLRAEIQSMAYGREVDTVDADCTIDMASPSRFRVVTVTGRNYSDRNGVSLNFTSNARDGGGDWDRDGSWRDRDHDRDRGDRRKTASGDYTDSDEWRSGREHFLLRYKLELDRNGKAKLTARSEDRNMPDDRRSNYAHGDILDHLQRGHDVVQVGEWAQRGNEVTIKFDRIEFGRTSRSQREVLRGTMRNGNLWLDEYDKDFYGHRNDMSFERVMLFR